VQDQAGGGDDDRLLRGACTGEAGGATVVLAVGGSQAGRVLRSVDGGVTWTAVVDQRGWIGACAFGVVGGASRVVFVGSARSTVSLDGGRTLRDHRDQVTPLGNWQMRDVLFDGDAGRFVAVGDTGVSTSADGITWTAPAAPRDLFHVARGNGRLVAVGPSVVATSTDAARWTTRRDGGVGDVVFADGRFLVVGEGFRLTSTDGASWARATQQAMQRVGAGLVGGTVVWVGASFPDARFVSTDGTTWTATARDGGNAIDDFVFVP
jgi:hypothetical protein